MRVERRAAVIAVLVAAIGFSACSRRPHESGSGSVRAGEAEATSVVASTRDIGSDADAGASSDASSAPASAAAPPVVPPVVPVARHRKAGWLTDENAQPGSDQWVIDPSKQPKTGFIEGYFTTTSAAAGDVVELAVSTDAASWTATAYRMGYYGGARGRLVYTSAPAVGVRQPPPTVDKATGMAEARWPISLRVPIGDEFVPGTYLFKLSAEHGAQILVPLTIRDDESTAAILIINAVTTWQAYNDWGACSLYRCRHLSGRSRATVVSFDRPYEFAYNQGTADFIDHELALIALVEELGLDVTYITNIDQHRRSSALAAHKAILSLGHDEYYSRPMYDSLVRARDSGVNLAFLGANAVYRAIRLEPNREGRLDRVMVNYRSTDDPMMKIDPSMATVQWRVAPHNRPENALIGVMYECAGVVAPMRITNARHWVFAGTGVKDGQTLPSVVGNEYDKVYPGRSSPATLEVIAHSPLTCRGQASAADMAYYTADSGAGVFATGTIRWICSIDAMCTTAEAAKVVRAATINVLTAFAEGPAAARHPAKGRS